MTDNTITPFNAWMRQATSSEQAMLADKINSSVGMLYQYSSGARRMSTERAAAVERVTKEMARASKGRLPVVYRTDTSEACRACPYAQKCLGDIAVASEFPVLARV
jgi:DNA-binding transcriptional regulator YdaS (Cro superfamily)